MLPRISVGALAVTVALGCSAIARADDALECTGEHNVECARAFAYKEAEAARYPASGSPDWQRACNAFQAMDDLKSNPLLDAELADCRAHLGEYLEAHRRAQKCVADATPTDVDRRRSVSVKARCEELTAEIRTHLATVSIQIVDPPSSPRVVLNGEVLAASQGSEFWVMPGVVDVSATASGRTPYAEARTVGAGERADFMIRLPEPELNYPSYTPPDEPAMAPASGVAFDLGIGGSGHYAQTFDTGFSYVASPNYDDAEPGLFSLRGADGVDHDCNDDACTFRHASGTGGGGIPFAAFFGGTVGTSFHIGVQTLAIMTIDGSVDSPGGLAVAGPGISGEAVRKGITLTLGIAPVLGGMWGSATYFGADGGESPVGIVIERGSERFTPHQASAFYGVSGTGLAGGAMAEIRLGSSSYKNGASVGLRLLPTILAGPDGLVIAVPALLSIRRM